MKEMIFLAQSDTTVGFLSKDKTKLMDAKKRYGNKNFIITTSKLCELKKLSRVPNRYKKNVRKAKKTTFVYSNKKAIRYVNNSLHVEFLKHFCWLYSSSANPTKKPYDKDYATKNSDVAVLDIRGLKEDKPSSIVKIGTKKMKKLR